ncbi:MAG: hemolysin III family protein, partial [Chloroflexi bacterium]|nr:hemolysin III family protein [Chloroflexota bacterium]
DHLFSDLDPVVLGLLVAGGVIYTVGVLFHLLKNWVWYSAVWHGFVLTASVVHFVAIWGFILPAA